MNGWSNPPPQYPLIYTIKPAWKMFVLLAGTAFIVLGFWGAWFFSPGKAPDAPLLLVPICLGFAVLGLYGILSAVRYRVVLTAAAIEVVELFKARKLQFSEISGRRTIRAHNSPPIVVLVPRDETKKSLKIPAMVNIDLAFEYWLDAIPDLDLVEEQRLERDVAANPLYGHTPEERIQRLADLRRLTRGLGMAGMAVALWGWFYPRPYELVVAVLILFPVAGYLIAANSKGLIQIDQQTQDKRPSIGGMMLIPPIVLAFRGFADIHLVDWQSVLEISVAGGVLLVALIMRVDRQARKWTSALLFLMVFALPYAYGTVVEANVLLDKALTTCFKVKVQDKHVITGKYTTWELNVGPWGPVTEAQDVTVSRSLYQRINQGDMVCVELHRGAIGLQWYTVGPCMAAG